MDHLDGHRGGHDARAFVLAEPGCQEDQGRSQALTAGDEKLAHRLRDDIGIPTELETKQPLQGCELGRDGPEDVYVGAFCSSQIRTSSASIVSPKRLDAISLKCSGTAVTSTSCPGRPPPERKRE